MADTISARLYSWHHPRTVHYFEVLGSVGDVWAMLGALEMDLGRNPARNRL